MKVPLIFFSTCALIERQSALQSVKRAGTGPDPRVSAAIQGGLLGAGGGALVQVLRRMLQTKQEQEEEGSPSILKGMLMGGLGGAGLGAGAAHLLQGQKGPLTPEGMRGLSPAGQYRNSTNAMMEAAMKTPESAPPLTPQDMKSRTMSPELLRAFPQLNAMYDSSTSSSPMRNPMAEIIERGMPRVFPTGGAQSQFPPSPLTPSQLAMR